METKVQRFQLSE